MDNREYCKRVALEIEAYYNGQIKGEDGEEMSLYNYMDDVLDYEFVIDSQKQYRAARIWVTLGGPNVWIDTEAHAVKLAWGTDRAEYPLDYDVCDQFDEIMTEIYLN